MDAHHYYVAAAGAEVAAGATLLGFRSLSRLPPFFFVSPVSSLPVATGAAAAAAGAEVVPLSLVFSLSPLSDLSFFFFSFFSFFSSPSPLALAAFFWSKLSSLNRN
jgi:hypothetical protein